MTTWPKCRDSSVTHCTTFPDLTEYELVSADPAQGPVPINGDYVVKCFHDTFVTNEFKVGEENDTRTKKQNYDMQYTISRHR